MISSPDINETTIDEKAKEPAGFFSDRWKGAAALLALVLFTAAVMKAVQLATVPVLGEGLFHARWFEFCLVEFELAFGLWLLGGQLPRWTRLAVIALFSLFGLVSLFKALSGEALLRLFRRSEGQSLVHDRAGRGDGDPGALFPAEGRRRFAVGQKNGADRRYLGGLHHPGRRRGAVDADKPSGGPRPGASFLQRPSDDRAGTGQMDRRRDPDPFLYRTGRSAGAAERGALDGSFFPARLPGVSKRDSNRGGARRPRCRLRGDSPLWGRAVCSAQSYSRQTYGPIRLVYRDPKTIAGRAAEVTFFIAFPTGRGALAPRAF